MVEEAFSYPLIYSQVSKLFWKTLCWTFILFSPFIHIWNWWERNWFELSSQNNIFPLVDLVGIEPTWISSLQGRRPPHAVPRPICKFQEGRTNSPHSPLDAGIRFSGRLELWLATWILDLPLLSLLRECSYLINYSPNKQSQLRALFRPLIVCAHRPGHPELVSGHIVIECRTVFLTQ